ncbi:abortive phage infection protein [Cryobacterium roopkundense]|uniref:Abortive phage infection protein n=1 Tax=Cryobacterium roopkundense TaxID=1001240 RepID=A0A099J5U5_9MICO|nr:CPBP family intramembrane glutamic endopeptidase [Cryobacterium roopkundense]KGJ72828.1 abortive phage infection protein [Cryobacterium roopkundense]MBB5642872.1 membrane protease YdiL (CAAX protease family) [Cryobacterium roopkundense]
MGTSTVQRAGPWGLVAATGVSASAVLLFALRLQLPGYAVLLAALVLAYATNRALFRDLLLIAVGLGIISTISVEANIDYANIALMGTVLSLSVLVPYLSSRYVYREHAIRFPIHTGQRWTTLEKAYLPIVVLQGYLILPSYFIGSGAYQNWPVVSAPDEIARLFVGVGFVGIWDELFFICVAFTLLRRHFPDWQANLLQAVIFCSFLWELGYQSWGPLLTFPFALLQGYTFARTRSLTYVVCVHLLFDAVVFLVLVHAHHPEWLDIFWY